MITDDKKTGATDETKYEVKNMSVTLDSFSFLHLLRLVYSVYVLPHEGARGGQSVEELDGSWYWTARIEAIRGRGEVVSSFLALSSSLCLSDPLIWLGFSKA